MNWNPQSMGWESAKRMLEWQRVLPSVRDKELVEMGFISHIYFPRNRAWDRLAKAVGLDIQGPELTEVGYSLNAILEAMNQIDVDGLNAVEPLPIIPQSQETGS